MTTERTTTPSHTPDADRGGTTTRRLTRWVPRLLPVGMATMVWIDHRLGESAEYFNAYDLLRSWGGVLTGDGPGGHSFLIGQDHLGAPLSLGLGSAVFVLEPAIALTAIGFVGAAISRAITRASGGRRLTALMPRLRG